MIEIRNILCPVDFSDFSARALDHAKAIARRYGSNVTLVLVWSGAPALTYAGGTAPVEAGALTETDRKRLTSDLRRFAGFHDAPDLHIEAVVREGNTVAAILDVAGSIKADLLAIGTHGRSGFERLLLGSVTEKLLRKAPCPVLTVPGPPDSAPAGPGLFKRILCPIDFSDSSMVALRYALSLAQENDAELVVLYVVPNDFVPLPGQPLSESLDRTISVADFFIKREEHVRTLLKDAVPETVRAYCTVDTTLAHGKPSTEILRIAAEHKSDLIVIGVRGRGAADLAVFGSTTQHVVRHAPCPVLTIRQG